MEWLESYYTLIYIVSEIIEKIYYTISTLQQWLVFRYKLKYYICIVHNSTRNYSQSKAYIYGFWPWCSRYIKNSSLTYNGKASPNRKVIVYQEDKWAPR